MERDARAELGKWGLSPKAQSEVITGRAPSTPENVALALSRKLGALADPAWVQRYSSGGMVERSDMLLWDSVISNAPDELRRKALRQEQNFMFRNSS